MLSRPGCWEPFSPLSAVFSSELVDVSLELLRCGENGAVDEPEHREDAADDGAHLDQKVREARLLFLECHCDRREVVTEVDGWQLEAPDDVVAVGHELIGVVGLAAQTLELCRDNLQPHEQTASSEQQPRSAKTASAVQRLPHCTAVH